MKVTREKLFIINDVFDRLSKEKANTFFHYILTKNKQLIENELKAIEAARTKPNEGYAEFEKKRMTTCEELCKRDENDRPVVLDPGTPNARYDFSDEARVEVNDRIEALKVEYKSVLDEFDNAAKQFNELISEEIEIEFKKFKLNHLPEEIIGNDMNIIFDLIQEE